MTNASDATGWNSEYRSGRWAFLRDLPESGRYGIIGMWLSLTGNLESVLDVGCGEGLLYERLAPMGLRRYMGVDLAPAALELASVDSDVASLRAADMHTFTPEGEETYSAIIFNEVLHFASDPAAVVSRYRPFLKRGGVMALSMYAPNRTESGANRLIAGLWNATDDPEKWRVLDDYQLYSHQKDVAWRLRLITPISH
ncbi:class I SAM-dependent methyltransferase [Rhodobacteraceae bacterium RKSG542]|uniref:class I SAM-dependent methyltransferase n=1 Tax=Pseudovibrio flavus TaxID=2529854 RepID=UPI0012BBC24D|nr:class I SAM-dependent methyltransferase [Pseudovibrio flavus]MTI17028.1 class I SAM-dependent methyltransferase [Pseudovibrio flavus]